MFLKIMYVTSGAETEFFPVFVLKLRWLRFLPKNVAILVDKSVLQGRGENKSFVMLL